MVSVSFYVSALYLAADWSGPAVVLGELLLHVRQPADVLANQHDHRHEHGEHISLHHWHFLADP